MRNQEISRPPRPTSVSSLIQELLKEIRLGKATARANQRFETAWQSSQRKAEASIQAVSEWLATHPSQGTESPQAREVFLNEHGVRMSRESKFRKRADNAWKRRNKAFEFTTTFESDLNWLLMILEPRQEFQLHLSAIRKMVPLARSAWLDPAGNGTLARLELYLRDVLAEIKVATRSRPVAVLPHAQTKPSPESDAAIAGGGGDFSAEKERAKIRCAWLDRMLAENGWTSDKEIERGVEHGKKPCPTYNTIQVYRSGRITTQIKGTRLKLANSFGCEFKDVPE